MEQFIIISVFLYSIFLTIVVVSEKLNTIKRLRLLTNSDYRFYNKEINRLHNEVIQLRSMTEAINGEMLESFNCQNEYIDVCIDEIKYKTGLKNKVLIGDVNTPDYAILDKRNKERRVSKDRRN